jgi:UDP-N-acetyl-D-glucosamine dehydrogenase
MPRHVVNALVGALSDRFHKSINGSRILLVGLAYKKNVDDMRESPSLRIIEMLEHLGATVDYYDSYIPVVPPTREHAELTGRKSVEFSADVMKSYDAAFIATDHDDVDYQFLADHIPLVIDTRNVCERTGVVSDKVVKA